MRTTTIIFMIASALAAPPALHSSEGPTTDSSAPPGTGLTLSEALARAAEANPGLAAARSRADAAAARVDQASVLPNPELELEVENFGGSGELSGFGGAESTIAIAQSLAIGGARARRVETAQAEADLAAGETDLQHRELRHRVKSAYFQLLAAQEHLALTLELSELAKDFADTVAARVEAGKVSPIEATRARIETAHAEVAHTEARRQVDRARLLLAATWGQADPTFERAAGTLPAPCALPPLLELEERLGATPEAEQVRRTLRLHERSLALEKALAVPDLQVSVGARRFRDTAESAWMAGVAVPIPIFDRNRGARRAAEFELEAARRSAQAVETDRRFTLRTLIEDLRAAAEAVSIVTEVVEPAAREAFTAVSTGYLEGKFDFTDHLQAKQALFDARVVGLEKRLEYAQAHCNLELLVGPLSPPAEKEAS